ncbi:hypothetical protein PAXRUDRAFT_113066, partial [Paxillus rubicundulus Ve08.2h10]
RQEERKKNKNKFLPISNNPLLLRALLIILQYTVNKIRKEEYVLLYYYTNRAIREAEEDTPSGYNVKIMMLVQTDNGPTFQMASAIKAKQCKMPDESLSWEEFSQANYCMLNTMRQQD